jgi:rhodanese-related sulfurtransferase
MLNSIKSLFGMGPKIDYSELVKNGAKIIDVRTPSEYKGGHIKGSTNIPLQDLQNKIKSIDKSKVVITCCASGMRSASAKSILLSKGFKEVHNGGGWQSLQNKL